MADAPAVHVESETFSATLSGKMLQVELKDAVGSIREARDHVEPYLRTWELERALERGDRAFTFEFETAFEQEVAGEDSVRISSSEQLGAKVAIELQIIQPKYPDPPSERFVVTPDVASLWFRYRQYREGGEPLPGAAYFCLTVVEGLGGTRKEAATLLGMSDNILDTIGELCSRKGGPVSGRKADSTTPLSRGETEWLEKALLLLIRRVGECAAGGVSGSVTMADLPRLERERH